MNLFIKPAAALLLLLASCTIVTITALKVYDSSRNPVYAYTGGIKTNEYHAFVLPEVMSYFYEVVTAEGETYEGGPCSNYGSTQAIFSADYDVLEYGEGGRL
ncbi:MAG: hypothetical protein LBP81_06690 [Treponema sp.]|jgi:hypothetical protein|nr:hypothetical protein [Treponema sp.]